MHTASQKPQAEWGKQLQSAGHPPVCQLASPEPPTLFFKGLFAEAEPLPCLSFPYFIRHSTAWNIPVVQLSFWASPDMLSKGHQIQSSLPYSLLAWRSAKLRLSGSTPGSRRPLRCLSKQRLERNRCLGSTFRLETFTSSCLGLCSPHVLSDWTLLEIVRIMFLSQLLQDVLFLLCPKQLCNVEVTICPNLNFSSAAASVEGTVLVSWVKQDYLIQA